MWHPPKAENFHAVQDHRAVRRARREYMWIIQLEVTVLQGYIYDA